MRFRRFPWFGVSVTLLIAATLAGVSYLVWADVRSYRSECHATGGHVVEVRGTDICVDRENRVVFL